MTQILSVEYMFHAFYINLKSLLNHSCLSIVHRGKQKTDKSRNSIKQGFLYFSNSFIHSYGH